MIFTRFLFKVPRCKLINIQSVQKYCIMGTCTGQTVEKCKCFSYLFLLQVAMIQYFGTLCIFTNLHLGTLNRNLVKIIMLFYPSFRVPFKMWYSSKYRFVLKFAKNAYFHNPKNSKDDFNSWYNSKNLKIPKHYPVTLVLKLHGIVSKLK